MNEAKKGKGIVRSFSDVLLQMFLCLLLRRRHFDFFGTSPIRYPRSFPSRHSAMIAGSTVIILRR